MRFITVMQGVHCGNRHNLEQAGLCRTEKGRLVVVGDVVDLFDLLWWVDENPLTQFREISAPEPFEPSEQFAHLFTQEGTVR